MTPREHIAQLAADLGVRVEYHDTPPWWMWDRHEGAITTGNAAPNAHGGAAWEPYVGVYPASFVRPVDWEGQDAYATALHELGHHAMGHIRALYDRKLKPYGAELLRIETEAWIWAIDNAQEPLAPTTWGGIEYSYEAYVEHTMSEPDALGWELRKRIALGKAGLEVAA